MTYNEIQAINWSLLRHMRKSPKHYRHAEENERPDTDTYRRGRLVHTLVLQPERFATDYAVWDRIAAEATFIGMPRGKGPEPKITEQRRGKIWETFQGMNADRAIIPGAMLEEAKRAAAAVLEVWQPTGQVEGTLTWTDAATGLACKGRYDHLDDCLDEIKTMREASIQAASKQMYSLDYHCQLAHYRNGVGRNVPCRIIAVEPEAPYDVTVFHVDEEALAVGAEEVAQLLGRVKACRESGVWPGRYETVQPLGLPEWVRGRDEDDLTDLGVESVGTDEEEGEEG